MQVEDLPNHVEAYCKRHAMFRRGDKVLVGVSGGSDSTALLDILFNLRPRLGIELVVAHFNHKLRGEESDEDARAVARLAQGYGLPFVADAGDVAAFAKKARRGIEEAARHLRYAFFERVMGEARADRVALGHNADDQAETILFHFLRGSGTAGLAGMPPVRGPFVRPLLGTRRSTIEKYCRWARLATRIDTSNFDTDYTRNRIRLELIPALQSAYNPNLVPALLRMAEIIRADEAFMHAEALRVFASQSGVTEDEVAFDRKAFDVVPLALQRRLVRLAWSELTGRDDLPFDQVEKALEIIARKESGQVVQFPGGVYMTKEQMAVTFTYAFPQPDATPYAYPVAVPGVTDIPEAGAQLECRIVDRKDIPDPRELGPDRAVLDFDRLVQPLAVRNRRPGDVFQPFGSGVTRLKKFLSGLKVTRRERDRIPLLVDGKGRIAWVAGMRAAEWCRVDRGTTRALFLEMRRETAGFGQIEKGK